MAAAAAAAAAEKAAANDAEAARAAAAVDAEAKAEQLAAANAAREQAASEEMAVAAAAAAAAAEKAATNDAEAARAAVQIRQGRLVSDKAEAAIMFEASKVAAAKEVAAKDAAERLAAERRLFGFRQMNVRAEAAAKAEEQRLVAKAKAERQALQDANAQLEAGHQALAANDFAAATAAFEAGLNSNANDFELFTKLTEALKGVGVAMIALGDIRREARSQLDEGHQALSHGDYKGALSAFESALELESHDGNLTDQLNAGLEAGLAAAAAAEAEAAARHEARTKQSEGQQLQLSRDFVEAIAAFQAGLNIETNDEALTNELVKALAAAEVSMQTQGQARQQAQEKYKEGQRACASQNFAEAIAAYRFGLDFETDDTELTETLTAGLQEAQKEKNVAAEVKAKAAAEAAAAEAEVARAAAVETDAKEAEVAAEVAAREQAAHLAAEEAAAAANKAAAKAESARLTAIDAEARAAQVAAEDAAREKAAQVAAEGATAAAEQAAADAEIAATAVAKAEAQVAQVAADDAVREQAVRAAAQEAAAAAGKAAADVEAALAAVTKAEARSAQVAAEDAAREQAAFEAAEDAEAEAERAAANAKTAHLVVQAAEDEAVRLWMTTDNAQSEEAAHIYASKEEAASMKADQEAAAARIVAEEAGINAERVAAEDEAREEAACVAEVMTKAAAKKAAAVAEAAQVVAVEAGAQVVEVAAEEAVSEQAAHAAAEEAAVAAEKAMVEAEAARVAAIDAEARSGQVAAEDAAREKAAQVAAEGATAAAEQAAADAKAARVAAIDAEARAAQVEAEDAARKKAAQVAAKDATAAAEKAAAEAEAARATVEELRDEPIQQVQIHVGEVLSVPEMQLMSKAAEPGSEPVPEEVGEEEEAVAEPKVEVAEADGEEEPVEETVPEAEADELQPEMMADVLDEQDEDLLEMAEYMGIQLPAEQNLLWIAEKALDASLPEPWQEIEDADGHLFFHNSHNKVSQYEHPNDAYFLQMLEAERKAALDVAAEQEAIKPATPQVQPMATNAAVAESIAANVADTSLNGALAAPHSVMDELFDDDDEDDDLEQRRHWLGQLQAEREAVHAKNEKKSTAKSHLEERLAARKAKHKQALVFEAAPEPKMRPDTTEVDWLLDEDDAVRTLTLESNGQMSPVTERWRQAATKIQAVQRGRAERTKMKTEELRQKRLSSMEQHALAHAADCQKLDTFAASSIARDEHRTASESMHELHGKEHARHQADHDEKHSSAKEKLRRRKSATKIQAIQRGRLERRKLKAESLRRKRDADKHARHASSASQLDILEATKNHNEKHSSANEKLAVRRRASLAGLDEQILAGVVETVRGEDIVSGEEGVQNTAEDGGVAVTVEPTIEGAVEVVEAVEAGVSPVAELGDREPELKPLSPLTLVVEPELELDLEPAPDFKPEIRVELEPVLDPKKGEEEETVAAEPEVEAAAEAAADELEVRAEVVLVAAVAAEEEEEEEKELTAELCFEVGALVEVRDGTAGPWAPGFVSCLNPLAVETRPSGLRYDVIRKLSGIMEEEGLRAAGDSNLVLLAGSFSLGEWVECRDDCDEACDVAWEKVMVTALMPLSVSAELSGREWEEVRLPAQTWSVGELVECRDEADEEWRAGIVTSAVPLIVVTELSRQHRAETRKVSLQRKAFACHGCVFTVTFVCPLKAGIAAARRRGGRCR